MPTPIRFQATLEQPEETRGGCVFTLQCDPREAFGKVRAPVKVTINGYTFRTTVASMGGCYLIGVNKTHRAGSGIAPGDRFQVEVVLDTEPRVIKPPKDLAKALKDSARASAVWDTLSYTHRREHVQHIEEAKREATRERRVAKTVADLVKQYAERVAKKKAKKKKAKKKAKKKKAKKR